MLGPAWTSRIAEWLRRPSIRIALVLLLVTCSWAIAMRREQVVDETVGDVRPNHTSESGDRADPLPPRIVDVARKLPQRQMYDPAAEHVRPIRADYVTRSSARDGNVHAAGFSAEVRANSPAWLTGEIEFDE